MFAMQSGGNFRQGVGYLYFYYVMIPYAKAHKDSSSRLGGVLVFSARVVLGENTIGCGWEMVAVLGAIAMDKLWIRKVGHSIFI